MEKSRKGRLTAAALVNEVGRHQAGTSWHRRDRRKEKGVYDEFHDPSVRHAMPATIGTWYRDYDDYVPVPGVPKLSVLKREP